MRHMWADSTQGRKLAVTEITQEAALYCLRCQRYRPFRYVERRILTEAVATVHAPTGPRGIRVIGHFYACTVCGQKQQWGCEA